ncbi:MAG: response regulator [Roseburia sp.]|nr:response regulator [Roseburia sp.]
MNGRDKKAGVLIAFVVATVVFLAVVLGQYLSFLDTRLFEERSSHIVEFTDKASEIVDGIIEHSCQQLLVCRYIVKTSEIASEEELLAVLASTSEFIDEQNSIVLAIDKDGGYYSSDGNIGRWPQPELLSEKASGKRTESGMQQIVSEIPHKPGNAYFIFMEPLEAPVRIGDRELAHLAFAVDIEAMREKISVNSFGGRCYTYLVNKDGRRLYKHTYKNNFIEDYNILNAFQDYPIVHGGAYEEFTAQLEQGHNTALEFTFTDEQGKRQNWFVANASIASQGWQILLFVPTEVLGASTMRLLHGTIWFFAALSVIFLIMIVIVIVTTMVARADKRLVQQKDEANRLLRTAADEANSANRAKSDFLSHMSHDIRTPINGIMGMTDIALKHMNNPDKVYDCLQKISGSSQHLLGLINDVLDMSRIESGKTKVNHESFNLRTCIDNCTSIIGGQLATRDIELIEETDGVEHSFLVGDELHLRQVFINILGNSVKFTPDGGKIYFRVQEQESADGKALFRFELADTGMGMKPEFLPHLFEAFAQEDDGMRTTYKGTGLGMAITKQFVDLMGGTIAVESTVNVGTTFTIELWIDIDTEAGTKAAKAEAPIDLEGMKVLLVEDIELNLEVAESILEDEGVIITPAMNGQEAVDAFANNPPGTFDAVLMDIMMPVMDGITATKTIRAMDRADAKTIPILAMTANAYEEDIRNTKAAGMNAHLSKPIDVDVLFKALSRYHPAGGRQEVGAVTLEGMKVLLADDVEMNLEIALDVLEEEKAVVTTVTNGREAVDAFAGNPPGTFDIILMDVHMPVMDGLAATREIRAMDRADAGTIPILAMTADVYEEDMAATKAAGMNGHLTKPLKVEKLLWMLTGYREGRL